VFITALFQNIYISELFKFHDSIINWKFLEVYSSSQNIISMNVAVIPVMTFLPRMSTTHRTSANTLYEIYPAPH
jgi:hypothetical protein